MVSDAKLLGWIDDRLGEAGYKRRRGIYRKELSPGVGGWISFPTVTRGFEKGVANVSCNVGVAHFETERIHRLAQDHHEVNDRDSTPTILTEISALHRNSDRAGWDKRTVNVGSTNYYVHYETGAGWDEMLSDLWTYGMPWIDEHNSLSKLRWLKEAHPHSRADIRLPILRFLDRDVAGAEMALREARAWAESQYVGEFALTRLDGQIAHLRTCFAERSTTQY